MTKPFSYEDAIAPAAPASAGFSYEDAIGEPKKPEKAPGLARGAADTAIAGATGLVSGVQMLSNVAGADNPVSRGLGKANEFLTDLESSYRKAEKQERAKKIKAAEESGSTWEEVKAYAGAFGEAPLDTTVNALGTSVPTLAAAFLTGGASVPAQVAARALPLAIGGAQGAGAVKGQIYEAVEQEHLKAGKTPEEAAALASKAQAYDGKNTGQIAAATGLGMVAGTSGAEAAARRFVGGKVAKDAAMGIGKAAGLGVLKETPVEMLQGGQERVASNLALQNEGFDTPTWRGVGGQAFLDGLASAPMGAGFGVLDARGGPTVNPNTAAEPPAQPPAPALGYNPQAGTHTVFPDGSVILNSDTPAGEQAVFDKRFAPQPVKPSEAMGIDPNAGAISRVAAEAVDGPASMEAAVLQAEREMAALAAEDNPEAGADPLTPAADPLISQVAGYVAEMGAASPQMVAAKFGVTIPRAAELLAQADPTVDDLFPPPQGAANVSNTDAAGALAAGTGGAVGVDADGGQPDAGLLAPAAGSSAAGDSAAPGPAVQESDAAPVPGRERDPALTRAKVSGLKQFMERKKAERTNVQDQTQGAGPDAAPAQAQPEANETAPAVGGDGAAEPGAATAGRAGVEAAGLKSGAVGDEQLFKPETGTLGVPRADMPQVPAASHGGLVKHLNAQGIGHETTTVDAGQLKPTQAEYSPSKVEAAKTADGDRAVIVSSDGHIIDGHHQALAAAQDGKPVKAIVLDAPVEQALQAVKDSPSAQPRSTKAVPQPTTEPTNAPRSPEATQAVETAPQGREETALLSDSVSTEPNLEAAKALLARQRAATGNAVAEGKVRKELRDLAAKTPETDTKTVLALDTAATRLGMGEGRMKGLEFKQPDAPAAPAVAAPAPSQQAQAPAATEQTATQPTELGRNNQPISEGGKPFKSRADADAAKKLQPLMRVKKVNGGFVLAEKTPAQIAAQAKAAKRLGSVGNTGPLAAHELLASLGGLNKSTMADLGFDRNVRVGARWLFSGTGGLTLERATESLQQYGYMDGTDQAQAISIIQRSAKGQPQYTAEGWDQVAKAEAETRYADHLAAQEEAAQEEDFDPFASLADDGYPIQDVEASGIDEAAPEVLTEVLSGIDHLEAIGQDLDSITERIALQYPEASQQEYHELVQAAINQAIEGAAQPEGRRDDGEVGSRQAPATEAGAGQDAAEGDLLTAPTRADIEAQQDRADAAARQEDADRQRAEQQDAAARERAEVARRSAAAADTFELGQDPLDNLTGQQPMFSRAKAKEIRNLVTLHNMTEANLEYSDSLGGMPVPSLGITKVDAPFSGFGNITLIGDKNLADPEQGVPVFDRDAWTARFPTMNFKKPRKAKADAFFERMKAMTNDIGVDEAHFLSNLWESMVNASVTNPDKVADHLRRYDAPRMAYARDVLGRAIKVPMRDARLSSPAASDKQLQAYWKKNGKRLVELERELSGFDFVSTPEYKAFMSEIEGAIRRYADSTGNARRADSYVETFLPDGELGAGGFYRLSKDFEQVGKKEVDGIKLREAVDKVVKPNDPAYLRWVQEQVKPLFEAPTITLRGKEVEPTLDNIVEAMTTGAVQGVEKSMTFGPGKLAAHLGKRFKSLAEIKAARDQVVSESAESEAKKATDALLDEFRTHVAQFFTFKDWRGNIDTWAANDASMEALARAGKQGLTDANIRLALARKDFKGVDQRGVDLARQAIEALRDTATNYFEAKPQRAVKISEFKGAVVPKDISPDSLAILEKNGITVEFYGKADGAREKAIEKLAKRLDRQSGDVVFSRAAAAGSMPIQTAQQIVDTIKARWKNAPEVVVLADMNDPRVPEAVRKGDAEQRSGGATGEPEGFYYKGTAYVVAGSLKTPGDVVRVLLHESLGHHGLRGVFGDGLKTILKQIATMRKSEVQAKAAEYGLDMEKESDRLQAAEEVLAVMAQNNPQAGFVKRAIGAIRAWLRENVPGLQNMRMTDNDIVTQFILPARRFVQQGPAGRLADGVAPRFSRGDNGRMTDTPAFRKWFGDSKVVDADGKPLVVYHGTSRDFDTFRDGDGAAGKGIYFSPDARIAGNYAAVNGSAGARVLPVYLSIANPFMLKETDTVPSRKVLERRGYDGVIYTHSWNDGTVATEYIAFRPEQVKSAIGNNGQFDAGNPDIRFSRSPRELAGMATDQLKMTLTAPGKLSWWSKTVGTMYGLAERHPAFKPVFNAAQSFIDDVSYYATDAADMAPKMLPKLENWRDIAKSPISAEDNKAIEGPVNEGTLLWARDELGRPVKVAELEAQAADMTTDQKARRLLRNDKISDGVLKMWQGLPQEQYEKLIDSRYESQMLAPGVVWTDAELKAIWKLNDTQIGLYREVRAAIDKSLDNLAKSDLVRFVGKDGAGIKDAIMEADSVDAAALLARDYFIGLSEAEPDRAEMLLATANGVMDRADKVTRLKEQGYAPLSRFGKYTVDVVTEEGRQYFGLFESMREANQMAARMRGEFGKDAVSQGTLSDESFKLFQGITPETLELFGNMLGLSDTGDTPQDQAFQAYLKLTKNNRSAMKRLIQRKGILGYSQDVGRVLANFIYSNARQTASALHIGDLTDAINAIPQGQGEVKDVAVKLGEYIKNPQEEAQAFRGLLFAQYLGGNISSAIINALQPFQVSFPYLSQFGGVKQAGAEMLRATREVATGKKQLDPELAAAIKRGEEDGTLSPQEVFQIMAQAKGAGSLRSGDGTVRGELLAKGGNAWSKTALAWGKVFGVAEQFNRRSTFIAAYRIAKAQKIADPFAFAKKTVKETQFVYSKANRPQWARGAIGSTIFTFKTYSISYIELLHRMATQGGPEGKRAALLGVAVLLLMGGAGGLPFMEDGEDIADTIAQVMGYNFSSKQAKQELLEELFGEAAAQFIDRGISGVAGVPIDVSGRFGMGNLIPGTGAFLQRNSNARDVLEVLGPAGDLIQRGKDSIMALAKGNVYEAGLNMSPVAIRNLAKGADMADTGMYRDTKGFKVIETTGTEAGLKAIGFQPNTVAKVQEANYLMQRQKDFYNTTAQNIRAKWARGLFEQDDAMVAEAREAINTWNEKNPDQRMSPNMPAIWRRVREMAKDKDQRIADTAPKAMRQQFREETARVREAL